MADVASKLEVSELDFDTIKTNLKNFLSDQNEFADYDFDGTTLYLNFNPPQLTKIFIRALAN